MANTTLYLAWQGLFPYKRFGAPFFWIGTLGVGLGVMLLIVVLSVMQGFDNIYRQKIVEFMGDIQIRNGAVMPDYGALLKELNNDPDVTAAAPFGQGFLMIEHNSRPAFPVVKGIEPGLESLVVPFNKKNEDKNLNIIKAGSLEALDEEGVMLSSILAESIGAKLGDKIEVYTPLMISKLGKDELMLPKTLKVVGIYETGYYDFDKDTMLMNLATFQDLYGMGDSAHGISLRLKPGADVETVKERLQRELGMPYQVLTWKDLFKDFLWVLDFERNMLFFLMLFVVLVAAFAMGAAQLMTVLRKTREIGLVMAVGVSSRAVAGIYALQGAIVGLLGVLLGNVLALLFLSQANPIMHTIARLTGTYDTLVKFYKFYNLPMSYGWLDAITIALAALILAVLSGVVPAIIVSKMKPAEALRNE
jgi:lipoprotein-releasing system permease protein